MTVPEQAETREMLRSKLREATGYEWPQLVNDILAALPLMGVHATDVAGWLVTFDDGGKCFYFERPVAEWKSDEFGDRGRKTVSIDPLFLSLPAQSRSVQCREDVALHTVAEQIVDVCRACRLGKTQASVDYNFDHSRAQCLDFVLTNLRGVAIRKLAGQPVEGMSAAKQPNPCPYCQNPDRDDNGNAIGGSRKGNCQWVEDKHVSRGADAPCVVDHYGTMRGGR